ncbi:two-component system histidine kinase PnpS [Bacillus infantis]|uniref:two-component system histidine kinase PnpS n=1 Tax=Bacillus infantis TaxID=324767 RepID=UPI003CF4AD2C
MTKFRTRLLFALITLIIAVLVGLGLLLGQLFKSYYLKSFDERLIKESEMLSTYIEDSGGIDALSQKTILDFGEMLGVRVTIVNGDGTIRYDSKGERESIDSRHEGIIKGILSKTGRDEEVFEVEGGFDLHYYWKPIIQDGANEGYIFLSSQMTELKKAYRQIWWILTVSLGLALAVIILLGSKIAARYTKPIESATNVAIELAKGNYRARTYEDNIDETGMLSSSINVLARNLQDMVKAQEMQQDRLGTLIENMGSGLILIDSRGYISLVNKPYYEIFGLEPHGYVGNLYYEVIEQKEITDLVEDIFMTEQKTRKQMVIPVAIERKHFEVYGVPIIGTNDVWKGILLVFHDITELKKLEQMRKDFVANVSHELKTPITSIKGFSETLLDGAMHDKAALSAFLDIILKESDRLQSLIQDLLDLSKTEQQGFRLSVQEMDLSSLLGECLAILNGKAKDKAIDIEYSVQSGNGWIKGDPHRLKQVFINLLTNAITYTPQGGKISVSLEEKEDKVQVEVKDTGMGIEQDEIPRIFERFYRIDKARSRNSGGTGLGLAIVKHLVEAHKGSITVESEVGKGTTFKVQLHREIS